MDSNSTVNPSIESFEDIFGSIYENFTLRDLLELQGLRDEDLLGKPFSEDAKMALTIVYIFVIVLAVLGNVPIILVVATNSALRTVTNVFLMSLAVADICIALVNMPFQIHFYIENEWTLGQTACKAVNYIQGVTVLASMFTMVIVAIDRYLAICHPLRPRVIGTPVRAFLAIVCIWVLAGLLLIPQAYIQSIVPRIRLGVNDISIVYICTEQFSFIKIERDAYNVAWYAVCYVLPVAVIAFSYVRIAYRIYVRKPVGHRTSQTNSSHRNQLRKKKKVIRMLITIVAVFILCWFPFFTLQLYALANPHTPEFRTVAAILHLVGYSNSALNPILYVCLNETFRQHLCQSCTSRQPGLGSARDASVQPASRVTADTPAADTPTADTPAADHTAEDTAEQPQAETEV